MHMKKMSLTIAASVAVLALGLSAQVNAQQANMTFFVTSAGPGEGKTHTAVELAAPAARPGAPT